MKRLGMKRMMHAKTARKVRSFEAKLMFLKIPVSRGRTGDMLAPGGWVLRCNVGYERGFLFALRYLKSVAR